MCVWFQVPQYNISKLVRSVSQSVHIHQIYSAARICADLHKQIQAKSGRRGPNVSTKRKITRARTRSLRRVVFEVVAHVVTRQSPIATGYLLYLHYGSSHYRFFCPRKTVRGHC